MIERHQDYQLTVPVVPPGGVQNIELKLDTDAPFALRLVRSRNIGSSGWRFKTPRGQYESNQLRTDLTQQGLSTFRPSKGVRIYPEMIFPIGAAIVCDIGNNTGENITNAKLLFRGSKMFRDGSIAAPSYPSQVSVLPYTYPVIVRQVPVVGKVLENQLKIIQDADFVFSYGVADPFFLGVENQPVGQAFPSGDPNFNNYNEVYVVLRDEARKAYSNEPIHINDLFGQQNVSAANTNDEPVAFLPGLMTPQLYIERNASIYFDVIRNDDPLTFFGGPVDIHFRFQGWKAFHR